MLEVAAKRSFGKFSVDVEFTVARGGITALFGRSGAGKTSTANMIAGLARPDSGRIALDGKTLFDSRSSIDVPPERRRIGYVFQEGRLFPQMTVAGNLAYGMRRVRADERRIGFDHVVALLGLKPLLERHPAHLSGGEKQRVAIGRAVLTSPRLLLLDEPLASLDAPRKAEILPFIEGLRDELKIPVVYVSHITEEVLRLADSVVLISEGRVAAVGPLDAMMSRLDLRPLTGDFETGAVLTATVADHDVAFGLTRLAFPGGILHVPRLALSPGDKLRVRIRSRDVSLALEPPKAISILNIFAGVVSEIVAGDPGQVDVLVNIGAPIWARITARARHDLDLRPGSRVYALVKAVSVDGQNFKWDGQIQQQNRGT
ncbi:MAG: molybdenum ABC transporter ATP-binding protein [Alphaproteobacteria bacterium]